MTCDKNGGDGSAHGSLRGRRVEVDRKVGVQITAFRIAKGMTIEEFGKALGISVEAATEIERGNVRPSSSLLVDISRVLDCRPEELFTDI